MQLSGSSWPLVLALALLGCAGGGNGDGEERSEPAAGTEAPAFDDGLDGDRDGLCDATEEDIGTDVAAPDSDGDGLPDLVELGNRFDPTRPTSPANDQVALLEAETGAFLDFPVRATVDGLGTRLTGFFEAATSAYEFERSAADFYVGARAVSADPGDNVRGINQDSGSFDAVLGPTRLGFDLRFEFREEPATDCTRAYPFRYILKSDFGELVTQRLYLLLVVPPGVRPRQLDDFCLPETCL